MLWKTIISIIITAATAICFTAFSYDIGQSDVGKYSNLPLPRYASVKANKANMRNGPSRQYPILWNYKYKHMPVRIVGEHENWRKVETFDGAVGWFHISLLSSVRMVIFKRHETYNKSKIFYNLPIDQTILFRKPDSGSFPIARVKNNTIAKLIKCSNKWCKVKLPKFQGWVKKENLWGVDISENIK